MYQQHNVLIKMNMFNIEADGSLSKTILKKTVIVSNKEAVEKQGTLEFPCLQIIECVRRQSRIASH